MIVLVLGRNLPLLNSLNESEVYMRYSRLKLSFRLFGFRVAWFSVPDDIRRAAIRVATRLPVGGKDLNAAQLRTEKKGL